MINRDAYLKQLINFKDDQVIKVLTGIRRCGKSTVLQIYKNYLLSQGISEERIIYINFEDMDFAHIVDAPALHEFIKPLLSPRGMNYIMLDEVQKVKDFQIAIDSLYIKKNVDIYITGSNAFLLSGELATLLSGRYIEIAMLPLSFAEYIAYLGNTNNMARKYNNYLMYSSFPQAVSYGNDMSKVRPYLDGIYNTVLMKDVIQHRKLTDNMMLESVVNFIFDNIGNLLSTNKIATSMSASGRSIGVHTVESYLSALMDSYLIYRCKRYDVRGKQYLKTGDKYYVCDIGLRYHLLGAKQTDLGRMLENVVFLELLRRGFNVYIGKTSGREIDFVAQKGDSTDYYQVALSVRDEATLARELSALQGVQDNHPKYLLTLDEDMPLNHNGVRQINALDWLLG
jgi:predicted AAA+ superfamily ATPase